MREYNISEVAKMFGISSESLRNYERKGLIAPLRGENGYRTYTKPDIYSLSGIRFLRNAGFSLEDVEKLCRATYDEGLAIRRTRCQELEKEIEYLTCKLQAMRTEYDDFESLKSCDSIARTISPAMLRLNNQVNDSFLIDDASILEWVEHMPIVRISPAFSKEAVLSGRDEVRFGYAVPLELARPLKLDRTPGAEIKKPQECLTTVICSRGERYLSSCMLKHVLQSCRDQSLTLTEDVWGITIGTHTEDGQIIRCHRLYFPVGPV